MFYVKNLPGWERAMRVSCGLCTTVLALMAVPGVWGWVLGAVAAVSVVSGLLGFCPACALLGRRLQDAERCQP